MAKVYVKTNTKNIIIEINSDIFMSDITGYTLIDEGEGDRYAHAQNNYLNKGLCDTRGRFNYIYENGVLRELTNDEKDTYFPVAPADQTEEEQRDEMLLDHEYRLSMIELTGGI